MYDNIFLCVLTFESKWYLIAAHFCADGKLYMEDRNQVYPMFFKPSTVD